MTKEEAIEILEEIIDTGWLISDFEKCIAIDACEMAIKALEQTRDFEGMTNGEVIQAVISKLEPIVLSNETGAIYFDWDWWNAPYQKGGE